MKILGLCGSPIKKGNAYVYLGKALEPIQGTGPEIEIVELAKKKIEDCVHCNWCLKNKDVKKICAQNDDGEEILHKIKSCDILVAASPAYYGRMTGRMASIFDRTRPFIFSPAHRGVMKDKLGVALTVGWGRNSGVETTLLSIVYSFMVLEMLPVSYHEGGALFGAAGISNPLLVRREKNDHHAIEADLPGILAAQGVIKRAVDLSGRIKR
ncbi:MAG: flavodoxin family protein [Proteobacteria bacterium]|nr:flavodoxin family protein [Pseudomonadota bacterium]